MNFLNRIEDFDKELENSKIVVTIFRAEWCPDCTFIDSFIDDTFKKFEDNIYAFNIDIDKFPNLKETYKVNGIPSFIAFKNGVEINRFVNRARKSREEISDFLSETEKF